MAGQRSAWLAVPAGGIMSTGMTPLHAQTAAPGPRPWSVPLVRSPAPRLLLCVRPLEHKVGGAAAAVNLHFLVGGDDHTVLLLVAIALLELRQMARMSSGGEGERQSAGRACAVSCALGTCIEAPLAAVAGLDLGDALQLG